MNAIALSRQRNTPVVQYIWLTILSMAFVIAQAIGAAAQSRLDEVRTAAVGQAITVSMQVRGEGPFGPWVTDDVRIHDNTMYLGSGNKVGFVQEVDDPSFYSLDVVRYERNTYFLPANYQNFWWNDLNAPPKTVEQWLATGQDEGSVFNTN